MQEGLCKDLSSRRQRSWEPPWRLVATHGEPRPEQVKESPFLEGVPRMPPPHTHTHTHEYSMKPHFPAVVAIALLYRTKVWSHERAKENILEDLDPEKKV